MFNKGDLEGAIAEYNKILVLDPKSKFAFFDRGLAYAQQKKQNLAIADYTKAIEIDPRYQSAFNSRGLAQLDLGNWDEAVNDFTEAISINSIGKIAPVAYTNRAIVRYRQKKYDAAMDDLNAALQIDPTYAYALNYRAIVESSQNKFAEAMKDYDAVISLSPNISQAFAFGQKGYFKTLMFDDKDAIIDYTAVLALDPKSIFAYWQRGRAKERLGDHDGAIADLKASIKLGASKWYVKLGPSKSHPARSITAQKLTHEQTLYQRHQSVSINQSELSLVSTNIWLKRVLCLKVVRICACLSPCKFLLLSARMAS